MDGKEKPIGYWLKEADKLITAKVNENLAKYNLTRFHWQVLNTIKNKDTVTKEEIFQLLQNFIDENQLQQILNDFSSRNWIIQREDGKLNQSFIQMTEEGNRSFKEILEAQQKTRKQLFEGLTMEDYETTIRVLKQVVENAKNKVD